MIDELENRLFELKEMLKELSPKTASESITLDCLQMQTYILGFQDAAKIVAKFVKDFQKRDYPDNQT